MCYSERTVNGVKSEETRYFIGSRKAKARTYAQALPNHWGIENSLHWQLDVTFDEDDNRVARRNLEEKPGTAPLIDVVVTQGAPLQKSIAKKLFAAALDTQFVMRRP
jgi:predicted transposase YbfD/YdcC